MIQVIFPTGKILEFPAKKILRQTFMRVGPQLVKTARAKMREPKTGELYRINGKLHRASAPGEAPADVTGQLFKSVKHLTQGHDLLFGSGSKRKTRYAKFLELGTKNMKERPMIFDSVQENYKNIENDITNTIGKLL